MSINIQDKAELIKKKLLEERKKLKVKKTISKKVIKEEEEEINFHHSMYVNVIDGVDEKC